MSGNRTRTVDRLTPAQHRHLSELAAIHDAKGLAFWRPANAGEERCAETLAQRGLLNRVHVSYSKTQYELTAAGRAAVEIGR